MVNYIVANSVVPPQELERHSGKVLPPRKKNAMIISMIKRQKVIKPCEIIVLFLVF